jgi:hypothetical protein
MPTDTPDQQRLSRPHRLHRLIATVAIASVAAVVLAACGSSSKSSSSSATNSASTTHSGTSPSNRFASLRACLQKEGINLGSASPGGQPGSGGPPGAGGGLKLPEGVSQSKFQEALKKCGGGFPGGARRGFNSATARAALTKYAACMRGNGVNLPAPNTSGNGPVFNTKGIDTSSAAFKSAQQKCQSNLKGAFGAGGRPPGGGEGGPPSGAEGGPPAGAPGPEGTSGG